MFCSIDDVSGLVLRQKEKLKPTVNYSLPIHRSFKLPEPQPCAYVVTSPEMKVSKGRHSKCLRDITFTESAKVQCRYAVVTLNYYDCRGLQMAHDSAWRYYRSLAF